MEEKEKCERDEKEMKERREGDEMPEWAESLPRLLATPTTGFANYGYYIPEHTYIYTVVAPRQHAGVGGT